MKAEEQRFWLAGKVEFTKDCWNWVGLKQTGGYGVFRSGGRPKPAHRVAWELSFEPIPAGMVIDHICHNKACVKPDHLRVVTMKQNIEHRLGATTSSKSGIRGVGWSKQAKKWRAVVTHHGRYVHVGYFADIRDAERAAIAKRNELFTHNDADRFEVAA
ncbi:MAG: HNH endonuclease [Actinomycetota bacterium]|nr:HNH endonuclease [Actinomycetota bacterium]